MSQLTAAAGIAFALGASPAIAAEPFSDTQKEALDAAIRDYILKNPEVILESLNAFQQRQEAEEKQRQRLALSQLQAEITANPNDPVLGNPDGDVTVVEFFDYQCGYCKRMVAPVIQLLKQDPNVRWVMKEFPILGPASVTAARASVAARNQGAYREFHVALMGYRGKLSDAAVFQTAREVGLDLDKLKADMNAPETEKTIREATLLARSIGINGTPAFIIGDEILPGAVSLDTLVEQIEAARKG
ncbi:DsbA family protein [Nisaea acidiphila]|uniref:DsbA family protein n=1 Tax=Nisaea acidiphila TaxID=1862145 RepID=A0A9J7AP36_9PROT|nr:DsbA family protein [Nisaea acidiphila]UUX49176.1 DsbA family protein [Nisaea acidiphila]